MRIPLRVLRLAAIVLCVASSAAFSAADDGCDYTGDGLCTQPDLSLQAAALWPRGTAGGTPTTIDLTLSVKRVSDPDQVTFTVGLADAADGSPLPISGYTLDIAFDETELAFASAEQLVPFPIGTTGFTPPNDCSSGRCTAGNILGVESDPIGPLFAITFDVIAIENDELDDFSAGILDPVFDDVSETSGQPVFAKGTTIVSYAVPKPLAADTAAVAIGGLAVLARRLRASADRTRA